MVVAPAGGRRRGWLAPSADEQDGWLETAPRPRPAVLSVRRSILLYLQT
eukprot:COSAG01_NODE_42932_length_435_cov_0.610119_2_plen_48_part_01